VRDLSQVENDRALDYLESTMKGVLDAQKGSSDVLAVQTATSKLTNLISQRDEKE
jgi:hypothetical protein